jgi:hypothetical protein
LPLISVSDPFLGNGALKQGIAFTFSIVLAMSTLYQMLGQAVRSEDPKVMLAKIQDVERTFEQRYGRKMTDYELSMLKIAREIVDRELRAENSEKKAA